MKIGLTTDSLGSLPTDAVLDLAAELGMDHVELATGCWSPAPHVELDRLLASEAARRELAAALEDRGLSISAFNCNGNQLHPGSSGAEHDSVIRRTIELAPKLGVERIVLMSGCPGAPGDSHPNWIMAAGMPEVAEILKWQWEEVVIPYWKDLAAHARKHGVGKLCIEIHGHQVVYNVPALLRLRDAVGPVVGVNFDPSHLMWMDADPIAAIDVLGDAIYHVHAKDTRLEQGRQSITSRLDTTPQREPGRRSWNYVTLGYGSDEAFWRGFCLALRRVGYDDVLSIEHEDMLLTPLEGVRKSVELLRRVMPTEPIGN